MYDQLQWTAFFNSQLALQAIFTLSAFLSTYTLLLCIEKTPFTGFTAVLTFLTRWMRLTPTTLYVLAFSIYWAPELGSGPHWGLLVRREAEACAQRWYHVLFHLQNHVQQGEFCLLHTWYISVDMQLSAVSLLLMYLFTRRRVPAAPVLGGLILLTALGNGLVTYVNDFSPIVNAQSPENIRTQFRDTETFSKLYFPLHVNMAGQAAGMLAAYFLYTCQNKGIDLANNRVLTTLYNISLGCGFALCVSGALFLGDTRPSRLSRALYCALDRVAMAVCFAIFLVGLTSRTKSALKDIFSWRGFHILGRLSYCVFLVHFTVMRLLLAQNTTLLHVGMGDFAALFMKTVVASYVVAIPLSLCIEMPFYELWKSFFAKDSKSRPVANGKTKQHIQ